MLKTRQARKASTRVALTEAALASFAQKGFAATQIADITALAGVAKGTFYVHFATKEALLDASLEGFIAQLADAVRPALMLASGRPLASTVEAAATAAVALFREERVFVRAYAERTASGLDPAALPFGLNAPAQMMLASALAARAEGALTADADLVIHGVLGMWLRLLLQPVFRPELDDDAVVRALTKLTVGALEGVLPRRARDDDREGRS
jgi:AcrR family transcriptional regulator